MIRFLRWALGLNPIDLLRREIKEAKTEAARAKAESRNFREQTREARGVLQATHKRNADLVDRLTEVEAKLALESAQRLLYEQVLLEAGQQIAVNLKSPNLAVKTFLGVLRDAFAEALATAEAWSLEGHAEPGMVTNARATLANRLLPEPEPVCCTRMACYHPDKDHLAGSHLAGEVGGRACTRCGCIEYVPPKVVTTRNRTGLAGDSAGRATPGRAHRFEYSTATTTSADPICALPGCGKPYSNSLHRPSHPYPTWNAEKRAEDGPPEVLPDRGLGKF